MLSMECHEPMIKRFELLIEIRDGKWEWEQQTQRTCNAGSSSRTRVKAIGGKCHPIIETLGVDFIFENRLLSN